MSRNLAAATYKRSAVETGYNYFCSMNEFNSVPSTQTEEIKLAWLNFHIHTFHFMMITEAPIKETWNVLLDSLRFSADLRIYFSFFICHENHETKESALLGSSELLIIGCRTNLTFDLFMFPCTDKHKTLPSIFNLVSRANIWAHMN